MGALEFYADLIEPSDLVFDIGANLGARTSVFLELGAAVVAVEPQHSLATRLASHMPSGCLNVIEAACGAAPAVQRMYVCEQAPTLTSLSPEWIETVKASGRFDDHRWSTPVAVRVTTLDRLIEAHGTPAFVKIDVEGYEWHVLTGLSVRVPLSFEWSVERMDDASACFLRLLDLGYTQFAVSFEETMEWATAWTDARTALGFCRAAGGLRMGDVYAR